MTAPWTRIVLAAVTAHRRRDRGSRRAAAARTGEPPSRPVSFPSVPGSVRLRVCLRGPQSGSGDGAAVCVGAGVSVRLCVFVCVCLCLSVSVSVFVSVCVSVSVSVCFVRLCLYLCVFVSVSLFGMSVSACLPLFLCLCW